MSAIKVRYGDDSLFHVYSMNAAQMNRQTHECVFLMNRELLGGKLHGYFAPISLITPNTVLCVAHSFILLNRCLDKLL